MTMRKWLCEILCDPCPEIPHQEPDEPYCPFEILHHISGNGIYKALHEQYPNAHIRIADTEYATVSLDEFNRWIREDCVSERKYWENWFDCDNFARSLRCSMFKIGREYKTEFTMPYTEGMSPGGYHAFNIFVDPDGNVFVVEPQDDHVIPSSESEYMPDFIQL